MLSSPVYFKAFEPEIIGLVLESLSLFLNVLQWLKFWGRVREDKSHSVNKLTRYLTFLINTGPSGSPASLTLQNDIYDTKDTGTHCKRLDTSFWPV